MRQIMPTSIYIVAALTVGLNFTVTGETNVLEWAIG